jgi:hypothetical protein
MSVGVGEIAGVGDTVSVTVGAGVGDSVIVTVGGGVASPAQPGNTEIKAVKRTITPNIFTRFPLNFNVFLLMKIIYKMTRLKA